MMLNDRYGDCVWAAAGHKIMVWTANGKGEFVPSDADIEKGYESTGFNPNDPQTDIGTDPNDCLSYWRDVGIGGRKIDAWVMLNPLRAGQLMKGVELFETLFMAFGMPVAWQGRDVWDIPQGQDLTGDWEWGSWGGHMVMSGTYNPDGMSVVTWGTEVLCTWRAIATYCDAPYVVLSTDQLNGSDQTPAGLDWQTLHEDLVAINRMRK